MVSFSVFAQSPLQDECIGVEKLGRPAMKISISNLSEGVHAFHFSAEPPHLGLGDNFTQLVSVDITLDKVSREVFLKAEVNTSGRFICDRCAEEFDRPVTAAYHMVYIYDEQGKHRYNEDEVTVLRGGTTFIDITDDIRQIVLLAVPLKLLCSERCSGLCPHCGKNRNYGDCSCNMKEIDPRWENLKKHFIN